MSRVSKTLVALKSLWVVFCAAAILLSCTTVTSAPSVVPSAAPSSSVVKPSRPTASSRPAAASTRAASRVVSVPSSVDAAGSRDAHEKLQTLVNNAPNGATIVFKAGGTYRLDRPLWIHGKRNLTLEGNGATLTLPRGLRPGEWISLHISNSVGTAIRDFQVVGTNTVAGATPARGDHAIGVLSSDDTLIERVDIRQAWGDCLFVRHFAEQYGDWSDGVTFRDSSCRLAGRNGVSIESASRVRIVNSVFDELGYMFVDIEPGVPQDGASDVVIRGNTVGSYGLRNLDDPWFVAACNAPWNDGTSAVRDVTIASNTVEGNRTGWVGGDGQRRMKALHIVVCGNSGIRENFMVTNNTANTAVIGPSMHFRDVKGVTVTGNQQPLTSGGLAAFSGSTDVTYDGR